MDLLAAGYTPDQIRQQYDHLTSDDNQTVVTALTSRDDWSGIYAVVERDRVRIRPLPPSVGTI